MRVPRICSGPATSTCSSAWDDEHAARLEDAIELGEEADDLVGAEVLDDPMSVMASKGPDVAELRDAAGLPEGRNAVP